MGRSSRASALRAWVTEPRLPSLGYRARVTELGYRRPGLIVQADSFNRSRIKTVIVAVITGNVDLARTPGNVLLRADATGLPRDSVVNVSELLTLDRGFLTGHVGTLSPRSQNSSTGDCARCSSWRRKRGLGLFNVQHPTIRPGNLSPSGRPSR